MYIASARRPEATGPGRGAGKVAANVVALGAVSLVTDVSSEMVTAILPLYFVIGLGLNPLLFGFLDGLYAGATALARLAGGHVADRFQRRKAVAGAGYGISAAAKLGLLAAGSSVPWIGAALVADRAGKGLRTAPRDALISLSSDASAQGRAFGVHRAMDTVGAFLGPLVAFGILYTSPNAYDAVFVVSLCVALFAVVLLALFVRDHRQALPARAVTLRAGLRLLRGRAFRRVCLVATLLGLVTISDGFLYLLLSDRSGLTPTVFPLLPLGTAAAFLLLAWPLGRLADAVGAFPVFLGGHVALLAAYGVLLATGSSGGTAAVIAVVALHGAYYAASDGVLMALAGPLLPAAVKASGLALAQTGQAVARLVSSVALGWGWMYLGVDSVLWAALIALAAGIGVAAVALRPGTTATEERS
ncbi:MFS transporter [Phytomonospora sp. NPDC050363]|uniref:MFS transporter n=1 Tax=Phytomonospora sp. NPDC050363 TaxID=3155642 RepID=UPI0033F37EC9